MDLLDEDLKTTILNVFKELKENTDKELKEVKKITYAQMRISVKINYKKEPDRYSAAGKYN